MLTLNNWTVQPCPTSPVLFTTFAAPVLDFAIGTEWRLEWWGEKEEQALTVGIVSSSAPAPPNPVPLDAPPLALFELVIHSQTSPKSDLASFDYEETAVVLYRYLPPAAVIAYHDWRLQSAPLGAVMRVSIALAKQAAQAQLERASDARLHEEVDDWLQALAGATFSTRGLGRFASRRVAGGASLGYLAPSPLRESSIFGRTDRLCLCRAV
ncbi:hypothetical protein JCM1840_000568 [Sporobolomyces johnsonii]